MMIPKSKNKEINLTNYIKINNIKKESVNNINIFYFIFIIISTYLYDKIKKKCKISST